MTIRPEIGVMFRREQDPATLPDYARRVESFGFDSLWVVEDCFYLGGISQAATALAVTTTLEVGIGIAPAVARNAAFTAMEFATLARMHSGRFIGGIGHGMPDWMEQIGAKPHSWLRSMAEIVTAINGILAGAKVNADGEYVTLRDVQLEVAPDVVPPIVLGVRGPKSVQLAGRIADGVLLAENSAPEYVAWAREQMSLTSGGASRRIDVFTSAIIDDESPVEARALATEVVTAMLSGDADAANLPPPALCRRTAIGDPDRGCLVACEVSRAKMVRPLCRRRDQRASAIRHRCTGFGRCDQRYPDTASRHGLPDVAGTLRERRSMTRTCTTSGTVAMIPDAVRRSVDRYLALLDAGLTRPIVGAYQVGGLGFGEYRSGVSDIDLVVTHDESPSDADTNVIRHALELAKEAAPLP